MKGLHLDVATALTDKRGDGTRIQLGISTTYSHRSLLLSSNCIQSLWALLRIRLCCQTLSLSLSPRSGKLKHTTKTNKQNKTKQKEDEKEHQDGAVNEMCSSRMPNRQNPNENYPKNSDTMQNLILFSFFRPNLSCHAGHAQNNGTKGGQGLKSSFMPRPSRILAGWPPPPLSLHCTWNWQGWHNDQTHYTITYNNNSATTGDLEKKKMWGNGRSGHPHWLVLQFIYNIRVIIYHNVLPFVPRTAWLAG